ncbi:MAG: metallophosphoesterase [Desulfopila sp.]|jgi:Icc-related predicted phosphoesterase|nr:metallophosphoesterase [Desulfopila sp.]
MKIIVFGDIHMVTSTLRNIENLTLADLLIVTGDITNFGNRNDAKKVLNDILSFNRNLLCLAGNLDNSDINDYLEDLGMNLHGQAHMVRRRICVFGVGGSNPTPFRTPWEFKEDELYRIALDGHRQAKELIGLAEPITGHKIPLLFVSHAPPYGTTIDRLRNGRHVGSKAIRKFIENYSPDLCVSGHMHEARGEDILGETRLFNPGMLMQDGWVTITLHKNHIQSKLQ